MAMKRFNSKTFATSKYEAIKNKATGSAYLLILGVPKLVVSKKRRK